jgi:hypothetical protein
VNDILRDMEIDDATRGAHADGCIECSSEGCSGCPAGSACELPRLVEHEGEHMHEGCVAAFDKHTDNRCTGDVCNCETDGVPLTCDIEETTPTAPMSDREIAKLDPLGIFSKEAA